LTSSVINKWEILLVVLEVDGVANASAEVKHQAATRAIDFILGISILGKVAINDTVRMSRRWKLMVVPIVVSHKHDDDSKFDHKRISNRGACT
jgi:hypothetical protein